MTKTEAAALDELRMTPEQLAARAAELDVKFGTHTNGAAEITTSRARKPRSDKGTVKGPKVVVQAPAGSITSEQSLRLRELAEKAAMARLESSLAQRADQEAARAYHEFVDSLTAK